MQNAKALAAIFVALLMGTIAATLVSGCRPAARRGGVGNTGSTTTDAGPRISIPKDEVKEEKAADEKAAEEKEKPVLPKGETPSDGNPDGVKPADEKPTAAKPADEKSAVLPKGETPTDGNPDGV